MRKVLCFLCLSLFAFAEEVNVRQVSEAMGHLIAKNLQQMGVDFDLKALVQGLQDEQDGKASPLNEDECVQAIVNLQEEKISSLSEKELKKADAVANGDLIPDAPQAR